MESISEYRPQDQWPTLNALDGFGPNNFPPSEALAGRTVVADFDDGRRITYDFVDGDRLRWSVDGDGGTREEHYHSCQVRPGVHLVLFQEREHRERSVAMVLSDPATAFAVVSTVTHEDGRARVHQAVLQGGTDGGAGRPLPRTADLVGRRLTWHYSDGHAYEHYYLNDHTYTWHCLSGPEQGLADTEPTRTWRLGDGLYVFSWIEKVVPCDGLAVLDLQAMRSSGRLFGWDTDAHECTLIVMGARGSER